MTINVTLNNIANLQDTTTAASSLNANSAVITQGFTSALNVAGDTMLGTLNMNSQQIINLPSPATMQSPVRLIDLTGSSVNVNLGGRIIIPVDSVNCNSVADTAITIPSSSWRVTSWYVKCTTGALTSVATGIYTATGGGGSTVVAPVSLSTVSTYLPNTASNGGQLSGSQNTWFTATTVYQRITASQGSPAVANFYLEIESLP